MYLYLSLISYNKDFFSLDIYYISFSLAPQIVEAEQNLELQSELSTNIRININKANSNCKYNTVKGINLIHYCDMIYVTKTLCKCVLKWYRFYLQHPGGDRLDHKLITVCRWLDIAEQAWKLCITCKDCQKFKISIPSMGYFLISMSKPWRHGIHYV